MKTILSIFALGLVLAASATAQSPSQEKAPAATKDSVLTITEKPFTHVVGYCYAHEADERGKDLVFADGSLHRGIIAATTVRLDEKEVESLVTILTSEPDKPGEPMDCYDPHHAFVFYDAEWNIVASIDICLQCNGSQVRSLKVAATRDYVGLHKFIERVGLPIFRDEKAYTQLFKRQQPATEE